MHPRIHAESQPDKPALIMAATGETVTYGELERAPTAAPMRCASWASNNGDALAIACDNRLEFFDIYWAAQRAGLILVLLSARLKTDEIAYIVNDSGAKVVLISDAMASTAARCGCGARRDAGRDQVVSIGAVDGLPDWNALCAGQPATPIADEEIGGRMVYSSGTTGKPKGIKFASASGQPGPDQSRRGLVRALLWLGQGQRLSLPCPALSRRADGHHRRHSGRGRHRRGDDQVRSGRVPEGDRALPDRRA